MSKEIIINKVKGKNLIVSKVGNRVRIIKDFTETLPEVDLNGFFRPGILLSTTESKKFI